MPKTINLNSEKIIAMLNENLRFIRDKFSVEKIGLFGSFLSGMAGSNSDIDIIVRFKETSFDNYMDLKLYLEELFGRKVDLVIDRTLRPSLRYVKKEAIYV